MSESQIIKLFEEHDAVWIHDGDSTKPHAELTSGLCSNGFFDCMRVLQDPAHNAYLALLLIQKLKQNDINTDSVKWVVGSSYAAITFSYEVAKQLDVYHGFTEKDPVNPKKQIWQRLNIPAESTVLQIEELITTTGTFKEVRRAIEEGNEGKVNFLPTVGTIVLRPPKLQTDYEGIRIVALVEKEIWAVKPEDCPLCKAGSPRYRPKTHWKELTGKR